MLLVLFLEIVIYKDVSSICKLMVFGCAYQAHAVHILVSTLLALCVNLNVLKEPTVDNKIKLLSVDLNLIL